MGTWMNDDGLYIKYGTDEATMGRGGEYRYDGPFHLIELTFDAADLATASELILDDLVSLSKDYRVQKGELYIETAFVGATATLDIGMVDRSDRTSNADPDAFLAAEAVANLTAGATITLDGAVVGTTLARNVLVTAGAGTAAFTAGRGVLRFFVYRP